MNLCITLLVIVLTCLALKSNADKEQDVQAQRKIDLASILEEDDHDDKVSPKITWE